MRLEAGIAAAALWAFAVHVATSTGSILDRRMLADRNMVAGMGFAALIGVLMISTTALLPTMLRKPVRLSGDDDGAASWRRAAPGSCSR